MRLQKYEQLKKDLTQNFDVNLTNGRTDGRTKEQTNERTERRKLYTPPDILRISGYNDAETENTFVFLYYCLLDSTVAAIFVYHAYVDVSTTDSHWI